MELHGRQIIGGLATAQGAGRFSAANPASGLALAPEFCEATDAEVSQACDLAARAFETVRKSTPAQRGALLRAMADQIMAIGDALVVRAMEETGLPRGRIEMERGRTCNQLRMFATVVEEGSWVDARIDRALPDRQPLPRPDLRRMLAPIGPVAVFGASNFPLAFSVGGGDSASALAAGCPVVCKGHPGHPGASEMVARACQLAVEQCGFPAGTFALLQGAGHAVGLALATHQAIKAVGFTGSQAGGMALYRAAAQRPEPIPVYAEMGSTNPVFVLPGAMTERGEAIAQGLAGSATLGVGQFCTKPGMVFVVAPANDEDAEAQTNQDTKGSADESAVRPGNQVNVFIDKTWELMSGAAPGVMLHKGIAAGFEKAAARLGAVKGVETLVPGEGAGCAQKPRLFVTRVQTLATNPEIADEVFGPSTMIVEANNRDEILAAARALKGHLTATIHGTPQDLRDWAELVEILQSRVGRIIFNGWPTGVEVCHSMQHGGPFPSTTFSHFTSVGSAAITRWSRPICWQSFPQEALPEELRDGNPRGIWRMVEGSLTKD